MKSKSTNGHAIYMRRYCRKKSSLGLCLACQKPHAPGRTYCEEHGRRNAEGASRVRERRAAAGLCYQCGKNPPKPNRRYCQPCIDRAAKYAAQPHSKANWGGARPAALARDGHKCRACGRPSTSVHHIDGHGATSPVPNHKLENLITLCRGCHNHIERLLGTNIDVVTALLGREQIGNQATKYS